MNLKDLLILNKIFGKKVIHVEAPHIFSEKLIKHLAKYKSRCYCICPINSDYILSNFGGAESKKELEKKLKEIYLRLKEKGAFLQLHVHISMCPKFVSYKKKKELIEGAYNFFVKELRIKPREIVFGWWAYDKECEEICRELNLNIKGNKEFHVYDWWLK
jgi:hypothetical protein